METSIQGSEPSLRDLEKRHDRILGAESQGHERCPQRMKSISA